MERIKRLFRGRINRVEWVVGNVLVLLPTAAVGLLQSGTLSILNKTSDTVLTMALVILLPLGLLALLFTLIVGVALNIRRLHDLGHSGWTILVAMIPLVNIVFYFYLALKPGIATSNTYGEPPIKRGVFSMVFNTGTNV